MLNRPGLAGPTIVVLLALFGVRALGQSVAPATDPSGRRHLEAADLIERSLAGADGSEAPTAAQERADLRRFYGPGPASPHWTDAAGRPSRSAREALALVAGAGTDGLVPDSYSATHLMQAADALQSAGTPPVEAIAAFDLSMTGSILRYLRHLHVGRVDPRDLGFRLELPPERHDIAALLRAAVAADAVPELARQLLPPLGQYEALRAELVRYRALAARDAGWALPALEAVLRPGMAYAAIEALRRRLTALGDLAPDTPIVSAGTYDGPLVAAVERFQARHGLEVDGLIGKRTHAAFSVPLTWRVRQIELALERLRWLPDLDGDRVIALNIPTFHLWAWDAGPAGRAPAVGMRAVVGKAAGMQTPVFMAELREVILRPFWNVPRSILRSELLPILERDPDYLRRHAMEIVAAGGAAGGTQADAAAIAGLRKGLFRLRQRPGSHNALGLIKFEFPNDSRIYIHGTPAQELFGLTRRDFSHGCVRVEDPVALAEWVLLEDPEWTKDRIVAATHGASTIRIRLARPVPVLLFYITALVTPGTGAIAFAEDIYGHDARLDRALAARAAASRD